MTEKTIIAQTGQSEGLFSRCLVLGGVFLLSLLLRLFCWYMEPTLSRDAVAYAEITSAWFSGGDFSEVLRYWPDCWIPPLPVGLVLLLVKCGLSIEVAGIALNLALGSLIPLIVYRMAKTVTGDRSLALGATLLAAVHPTLIELSIEIQRDTTYLFLIGCVLCFLLEAVRKGSSLFWGVGGIFLGLAILSRFESLEFLPLTFCYLAGSVYFKIQNCRMALKQFAIFSGGVLAAFFLASWFMGVPFSYCKIYSDKVVKMVSQVFSVEKPEQVR